MARPSRYPLELRRRVVRMVAEVCDDYPNEAAASQAVADKLGIGCRETPRAWGKRQEIDAGQRPGTTPEESAQLMALKKENAELTRANGILKPAATARRARADLQDAHRTRLQDRPFHVLRPQEAPPNTLRPFRARPDTQGEDPGRLHVRLLCLRSPEGLARAEPAGTCGGPLHCRAPDAGARHPGCGAAANASSPRSPADRSSGPRPT